MTGKIVIRKAKVTDAKSIQEMLRSTWIDTYVNKESNINLQDIVSIDFLSPENISRREMKIKNIKKDSDILVATYQNKIIGECSFERKDNCGIVKSIYVLPDFQNKGVGSRLFNLAFKKLSLLGKIKIELATYNKKAFAFYSKLGFKKNNIEGTYTFPNGKYLPTFEMEIDLNI